MLISDFLMHRQTQRAPLAGARNAQNAKLKKCTKCKAREMQHCGEKLVKCYTVEKSW